MRTADAADHSWRKVRRDSAEFGGRDQLDVNPRCTLDGSLALDVMHLSLGFGDQKPPCYRNFEIRPKLGFERTPQFDRCTHQRKGRSEITRPGLALGQIIGNWDLKMKTACIAPRGLVVDI